MPNPALADLKKSTDSKKEPLFGRFGRKTGSWSGQKNILFFTFARLCGFMCL
jgi:hypothetical protein